MKTRRKVKVLYSLEGCIYDRPPGRRKAHQLTRDDLAQLTARYTVIIERVD